MRKAHSVEQLAPLNHQQVIYKVHSTFNKALSRQLKSIHASGVIDKPEVYNFYEVDLETLVNKQN
jgi:hypothetical protein